MGKTFVRLKFHILNHLTKLVWEDFILFFGDSKMQHPSHMGMGLMLM